MKFIAIKNETKLVVTMAILGSFFLSLLALIHSGNRISQNILEGVTALISAPGYQHVEALVDGSTLMISGSVSNKTSLRELLYAAERINGVQNIRADLTVSPEILPYLEISRSYDSNLLITGELPGEVEVEKAMNMFAKLLDHKSVEVDVKVNPNVGDPKWLEGLIQVAAISNRLQGMTLVIGGGQLAIGGLIHSGEKYQIFMTEMEETAASLKLDIINRVGISTAL